MRFPLKKYARKNAEEYAPATHRNTASAEVRATACGRILVCILVCILFWAPGQKYARRGRAPMHPQARLHTFHTFHILFEIKERSKDAGRPPVSQPIRWQEKQKCAKYAKSARPPAAAPSPDSCAFRLKKYARKYAEEYAPATRRNTASAEVVRRMRLHIGVSTLGRRAKKYRQIAAPAEQCLGWALVATTACRWTTHNFATHAPPAQARKPRTAPPKGPGNPLRRRHNKTWMRSRGHTFMRRNCRPNRWQSLSKSLVFLTRFGFDFGRTFSTRSFTASRKPWPLLSTSWKLATPAIYNSWLLRIPLPKEMLGQSQ